MFYPVAETKRQSSDFIAFERRTVDAAKILKCHTLLVSFYTKASYDNPMDAWDAAYKMQSFYKDEISRIYGPNMSDKQLNSLHRSKIPHVPEPAYLGMADKPGGWHLTLKYHMPDLLIPVARSIQEALTDPLDYAPRTRLRTLEFEEYTAEKIIVEVGKGYVHKSSAEKRFHHLLLNKAVKISYDAQSVRWRVHLTFWKLPRKTVERDRARMRGGLSKHFKSNKEWRTDEIGDLFSDNQILTEEGSGRSMGD